jgi:hypothetical protein
MQKLQARQEHHTHSVGDCTFHGISGLLIKDRDANLKGTSGLLIKDRDANLKGFGNTASAAYYSRASLEAGQGLLSAASGFGSMCGQTTGSTHL